MSDLTMSILELVISILSIITARYVIPYIKMVYERFKVTKAFEDLDKYVKAAEQLFGAKTGEQKREYVINLIQENCKKLNIDITSEQITALLESAVYDLNEAMKEEIIEETEEE